MTNTIKLYISPGLALLSATLLVLIHLYFNEVGTFWVATMWIGLFSAILVMLGQFIHTTKEIRNYSEQLTANKERLTNEIKHRLWAEKTTAESKAKSQFIDENIPVMLAYFNADQRCRYHNRLYRKWFGLKPDQIDGILLSEYAGTEFSASISNHIDDILSGKTVHEERVLKSTKGFPYIFIEQYIPHLDNKGKIVGFYTLHTPRAQEKHLVVSKNHELDKHVTLEKNVQTTEANADGSSSQNAVTAAKIAQAIDNGKFNIYCQKIAPIDKNANLPNQYEVLIRMLEEENNLMPPGSFLPLVDQFGLMPKLDRWVASFIIEWAERHPFKSESIFCINVAKDTLRDTKFIAFITEKLQKNKIPAASLCFEIEETDAHENTKDSILFTEAIRKLGCLVTLCSFGQSSASMELLKKMKFDYLKIDGSIVCNMLYDDEDMIRIKGINQIARRLSIKTIAELVETKETITKLQEIGINYAQGFGIAKPRPLDELYSVVKSSTPTPKISEGEKIRESA
ncbi:MAG: EAL domain-containing protein [Nitrosomonas sp.]|nr:EAL domain-containing protein [Nitrosomonas sp.]